MDITTHCWNRNTVRFVILSLHYASNRLKQPQKGDGSGLPVVVCSSTYVHADRVWTPYRKSRLGKGSRHGISGRDEKHGPFL